MKIINKLILVLSFIITGLVYAEDIPFNPGGGTGGSGTGRPANPIDMYVYVLAIIAIILITFYSKKFKTKKAL